MAIQYTVNAKLQYGYSLVELSAILVIASVSGTLAYPNVIEFVEHAEYTTLQYARTAFQSAVETAHAASILHRSNRISIENTLVNLHHSYPIARTDEMQKLIHLEGFSLENLNDNRVAIYSKYRTYCFVYSNNSHASPMAEVADIRKTINHFCEG